MFRMLLVHHQRVHYLVLDKTIGTFNNNWTFDKSLLAK
jgi:hypothetical protein